MKNYQVKLVCLVDAHNRSQVTTVIENPYKQNEIISIGHDSFIRVWNKKDLSMISSHRIISPYLMCLTPFNGKFLMGIGNGNLVVLNKNFQIQQQISLHQDCITSIVIQNDLIITTSYDGTINFINKQSFSIQKSKQLDRPIFQSLSYDGNLYIAANPSVIMNLKTLQEKQISHYTQFILHRNEIFGCSDENGVRCISQQKIYSHIPCQFMISMGDFIICFFDQGVGILYYNEEEQGIWKVKIFEQLKKGCSILSGIFKDNQVFVAGESGDIYKFQVTIEDKNILFQKQKSQILQQNKLISSQN